MTVIVKVLLDPHLVSLRSFSLRSKYSKYPAKTYALTRACAKFYQDSENVEKSSLSPNLGVGRG